jgi:oligopeptidase B
MGSGVTASKPPSTPRPPVANRRPVRREAHGVVWTDVYAWLRADNWQEVLRDPAALPGDIRAHLEAENAYAEAVLAPAKSLRRQLAKEMRARLKEDDSEVPQRDGLFAYYARYRQGGQHPLYCRRPRDGGREEVLFDGDKRAEGAAFFHVHAMRHSPDHARLAWSTDDKGSELSTIRVVDLVRGDDLDDAVLDATGEIVWTADSAGFLYVEQDSNHRPWRVRLHRLGDPQSVDRVVLEEADPAWFLSLKASRLGRRVFISVHGHDANEEHALDLAAPDRPPRLIAPRKPGRHYAVHDHGDQFFISTNADAEDFRIVTAPPDTPEEANWTPFLSEKPGRLIGAASVFESHLVLLVRENARPSFLVVDLATREAHAVAFEAQTYTLRFEPTYEFASPTFRFTFSSMNVSAETYDYDMASRERVLRKKQETEPGFDASAYVSRLIFVDAADGTKVPVSLLHRRDQPSDSSAPLLAYGYGAYGHPADAGFSTNRFSLVDRGWTYAIIHVRGGTDMGWRHYREGKLRQKPNTFSDFVAGVRALIERGYTSAGRVAAHGASAGGLLMGAVANSAPDLFAGIVGEVPFVDTLATILDETLPLTPPEWLEWGDPVRDAEAFATIRSYSPIDNVSAQTYPPILALAGLTDPRVTYWEPAKWVATLRARMTGGGPALLVTNMGAGHGGAPGRFDRLDDVARIYAFAILAAAKEFGP